MTRLDLSYNRIHDSQGFSQLTNLLWLDLSHNLLRNLHCLSECKHLRTLLLAGNRLSSVDGLQHMGSLTRLDLSHNILKDRDELRPLTFNARLVDLDLRGNPVVPQRRAHHDPEQAAAEISLFRLYCFNLVPGMRKLNGYTSAAARTSKKRPKTVDKAGTLNSHPNPPTPPPEPNNRGSWKWTTDNTAVNNEQSRARTVPNDTPAVELPQHCSVEQDELVKAAEAESWQR